MRRNKHLLLWSSLLALGLLLVAAVQENFGKQWRRLQRQCERAQSSAGETFEVRLRQIVVPALRESDRCVSCHVGMAPGEKGVAGDRVLGPHPRVVHDPAEFGCTVCHAGQGRATERGDAHGDSEHWPEPMIPLRYAQAGCGTCHTHLAVPSLADLRRGSALFERHDCLACHRLDGRGGTIRPGGGGMDGPDLSLAGARGYRADWYDDHLGKHRTAASGPWRDAFGEISKDDRARIAVLLDSRVGAPRLIEAKALFHTRGCRGCHRVSGVGGDDGPDLTTIGQKDPGQTDFSHVPGGRSIAAWFKQHFAAPALLVPGSQMPALGLEEKEADLLALYLLSLRRSEYPEAFWPGDRIRARRFGEREFASDGATLYGTFCAACHGPQGEGMRYAGMSAFPAIGARGFLELASDEFIAGTIRRGRPGRRMPAFLGHEGGLRDDDVERLVSRVRELAGGGRIDPRPLAAPPARGDAALGARLYAAYCGGCHGPKGEGGEGPSLANPVLQETASDAYLFETIRRGRQGTSMEAFGRPSTVRPSLADAEIAAILAHLRSWEVTR